MSNNYINAIYNGFINNKKLSQINKDILKVSKLSVAKSNELQKYAIISVKQINKHLDYEVKKLPQEDLIGGEKVIIATALYGLFNKTKIWENCNKIINQKLIDYESDSKIKILADELEKNRGYGSSKIFYLASGHNDSASDHRPYQLKMYVDEKWQSLVHDKALKEMIQTYINKNNVKSFQWVTSSPVYFITRPHCRHYFKVIDTKEVLRSSINVLIKKYNMHRAIGDRRYLQTINYGGSSAVKQDLRNAQLILDKYKQRLQYHQLLYRTQKSILLNRAITKDKFLIEKWVKYIKDTYGMDIK